MNGWTLDAVQSLDQDEYNELVEWIEYEVERSKHSTGDEESIDADEVAASLEAGARQRQGDDGDG